MKRREDVRALLTWMPGDKKPQLLGYVQAGAVVEQDAKTHQQVTLKFLPDPDGYGLTFKLTGTFLDRVRCLLPRRTRRGRRRGATLRLTRIPPRAKFPVKVTVVAWQWGRSIEPKLQTAEPVERTFRVMKPQ